MTIRMAIYPCLRPKPRHFLTNQLEKWITDLAAIFDKNEDPTPDHYYHFVDDPTLAIAIIGLLDALEEVSIDDNPSYYSACLYALDVSIAQLQVVCENGSKLAFKAMDDVMFTLATAIASKKHTLSFWLPILNAFYEVHVELSDKLKNAYLDLANDDDELTPDEEASHLDSIRDLINELSDLSVFDIAENFFAQSYAMPADFFSDLILDLYSIEEGHDIALLTLLHPKHEVREIVVSTLEQLMNQITLTPISLSRLQTIKNWYPISYHEQFNHWIKTQRKKGVVYQQKEITQPIVKIQASEIDGSGAQGIFVHLKKNRQHRMCGLLFKYSIGIKDAWLTPHVSAGEIAHYYKDAFDDSITLRPVDIAYLTMITEHFLAVTMELGAIPDLHLLEMQEELGLQWRPNKLDIGELIKEISVQISPFTSDTLQDSLKRSKSWSKNKRFIASLYAENAQVDKIVNRCCSFVDGVKVCRFEEAMNAVLAEEMELHREQWAFHFLWIAIWSRSKARMNEKIWQDAFLIAYAIHTGMPIKSIPIMHEICHQSVLNSIETMHERRTHLN